MNALGVRADGFNHRDVDSSLISFNSSPISFNATAHRPENRFHSNILEIAMSLPRKETPAFSRRRRIPSGNRAARIRRANAQMPLLNPRVRTTKATQQGDGPLFTIICVLRSKAMGCWTSRILLDTIAIIMVWYRNKSNLTKKI